MKEQDVKKAIGKAADGGGSPAELSDAIAQPTITELSNNGPCTDTDAIDGGGAPPAVGMEVEQSVEGEFGHVVTGITDGSLDAGSCPGDLVVAIEEVFGYDSGDE